MGVACTLHDAHNITEALEHPTVWTAYIQDLECHVLEESRKFYRSYGHAKASQMSSNVSAYLMKVRSTLATEESRCKDIFSPCTTARVTHILLQEMITSQQDIIMEGVEPHFDSVFSSLFAGAVTSVSELSYEVVSSQFEGLVNMFYLFVLAVEYTARDVYSSGDMGLLRDTDPLLQKLADGFSRFGKRVGDCVLEGHVQGSSRPSGTQSRVQISKKLFPTPSSSAEPVEKLKEVSECNESPVQDTTHSAAAAVPSPRASTGQAGPVQSANTPSSSSSFSSSADLRCVLITPVAELGPRTPVGGGGGTGASANRVNKQREMDTAFTEEVMSVVTLVDTIAQRVFKGHTLFVKAAKKALKHIVNYSTDGFDCMAIFASYCDAMIQVTSTTACVHNIVFIHAMIAVCCI
jgi:hypothetical protein